MHEHVAVGIWLNRRCEFSLSQLVLAPVCVIVNKRLVIVVFTICIHVVVLWSTRPRPINHTNTVLRSSADSPYFMAWCHSVGSEH